MCNNPDSVNVSVNCLGGIDVKIDECLVPLIEALQSLPTEMRTMESCCGHGDLHGIIQLADGRCLVIVDGWEEALTMRGRGKR